MHGLSPPCTSRKPRPGDAFGDRVTAATAGGASEARCRADVTLVGARGDDLGDLADRVLQLFPGVEEVRPEPKTDLRPEVAEDLPLGQLFVDPLESGGPVRVDGAAA